MSTLEAYEREPVADGSRIWHWGYTDISLNGLLND